MKYRPFGKLGWRVSALGFGAMRLPVIDNDQSKINEPLAIKMIRYAIDNGINYIDTAFPYHAGASEPLVAKALRDGYRDKIRLATKLPSKLIKNAADFDYYLNLQRERLNCDRIEFYMAHALTKDRWRFLKELGLLEWVEKTKADGRIECFGFSFHDEYDVFKKIIDENSAWDFCQVQYNYIDANFQAGVKGVKYAAAKGVPVVVMEPLRGGRITKQPPESIARLWAKAPKRKSPADWALQWVWNQPEVTMALSGMTTMRHIEENLASADSSGIGALSAEELTLIDEVREEFLNHNPIQCTECNYCMPCPNNVAIPQVIRLYNDGHVFKDRRRSQLFYDLLPDEEQAKNCVKCGECEEVCPQGLPVSELMEKIHDWLTPKEK